MFKQNKKIIFFLLKLFLILKCWLWNIIHYLIDKKFINNIKKKVLIKFQIQNY